MLIAALVLGGGAIVLEREGSLFRVFIAYLQIYALLVQIFALYAFHLHVTVLLHERSVRRMATI